MSEPARGGAEQPARSTTPENYTTTASSNLASGDYSYTVELVGTIQHQLGKLTEAVEALKSQVSEQGKEVRATAKDVHAAKVVVGVVGSLLLLGFGFVGWLVNTYLASVARK